MKTPDDPAKGRVEVIWEIYLAAVILAFFYFRVIGSESFSKVVHALR